MSLVPERIRALLFDLDGTLADTDDVIVDQLAKRLRPVAFALPNHDAHRMARRLIMSGESPFNQLSAWLDRLYLDEVIGFVADRIPTRASETGGGHQRPIPGVRRLLQSLDGRYPMAVVTTRSERAAHAILQQTDFRSFFPVVATARSTWRIKPHPAPVLWAARQLTVPPEDCLMIGDTTPDILAGRSAGAQTVGVLCGFGQAAELHRAGADAVIASTADLETLLDIPAIP